MDYETADLAVREIGGVTIVRLRSPNLTGMIEVQHIAAELDLILARGVRKVILDFKYVAHTGSAALGLMIGLQKKLDKLGGKLVLSHAEKIADLLRVSRTDRLFRTAADPREAAKLF